MNDQKVTVITICYNCITDLKKTVDSVISQKEEGFEYLVIDGGSNDGSEDYLRRIQDNRMRWISERDRGISDAFNKGIRLSKGEYICFLNAGDTFVDNTTMTFIKNCVDTASSDITFFQAKTSDGKIMPNPIFMDNEETIWEKSKIPHQAAFVKREIFDQVGFFNVFLKIRMDYDFFVRCRKYGCTHKYINQPIVVYDTSGISSRKDCKFLYTKEEFAIKFFYNEKVTLKNILILLKRYMFR